MATDSLSRVRTIAMKLLESGYEFVLSTAKRGRRKRS